MIQRDLIKPIKNMTLLIDASDRIKTLECALEDTLREIVKLTLAKMKSLLEYPASLER